MTALLGPIAQHHTGGGVAKPIEHWLAVVIEDRLLNDRLKGQRQKFADAEPATNEQIDTTLPNQITGV